MFNLTPLPIFSLPQYYLDAIMISWGTASNRRHPIFFFNASEHYFFKYIRSANFLTENSADHGWDGWQFPSRLLLRFFVITNIQVDDNHDGNHKWGMVLLPIRLHQCHLTNVWNEEDSFTWICWRAIISSPGVRIIPRLSSGIRVIGVPSPLLVVFSPLPTLFPSFFTASFFLHSSLLLSLLPSQVMIRCS